MEITNMQICQDLLALLKRIKGDLHALAESHNLTSMQLHALYAILQGETTMGKVAETLHCDASNVTGIVDRLVAQGMLTRHESPQDRRAKSLQLTAKGERIMDDIATQLPVWLGCSRLSTTDCQTLHRLVIKLGEPSQTGTRLIQ